jgi:hypothetical protein
MANSDINEYFNNIGIDKLNLLKEIGNNQGGIYIFYGNGNNGKTTYTNLISRLYEVDLQNENSFNLDTNKIIIIRDMNNIVHFFRKLLSNPVLIDKLNKVKLIVETNYDYMKECIYVKHITFENSFDFNSKLVDRILINYIDSIKKLI